MVIQSDKNSIGLSNGEKKYFSIALKNIKHIFKEDLLVFVDIKINYSVILKI